MRLIGFVSMLTPQIKSAASQLMIVFTMVEEIATGRMPGQPDIMRIDTVQQVM